MRARLGAIAAAAMVGLAACGGSPTSEVSGGGGAATDAMDEVYKELDGLEGEERLARLEELAAEEDQQITWYTSMNLDDSKPITDGFTEKYGIDVELYRAQSSDVMQRVLQESEADHSGADAVAVNGPEMQVLDGENLLVPLETPTREQIFEGAQFETWLGIYLNVFVAAWNTNAISESDAPKSWEDVLGDYQGDLAMELGDWVWFATLVQEHFMAEQGMSEDEAVDLFRQAARGAAVVDGHTTMAKLLAAGEYDAVSSAYQHRILEMEGEGAPVAWEDPVEPIIVRPNGIGIHSDTDAPASTLLFVEYALTEAQEIVVNASRTPANTEYGGLSEQHETLTVDFDKVVEQRDKWEKLYEEVIRESGSDVIEDN